MLRSPCPLLDAPSASHSHFRRFWGVLFGFYLRLTSPHEPNNNKNWNLDNDEKVAGLKTKREKQMTWEKRKKRQIETSARAQHPGHFRIWPPGNSVVWTGKVAACEQIPLLRRPSSYKASSFSLSLLSCALKWWYEYAHVDCSWQPLGLLRAVAWPTPANLKSHGDGCNSSARGKHIITKPWRNVSASRSSHLGINKWMYSEQFQATHSNSFLFFLPKLLQLLPLLCRAQQSYKKNEKGVRRKWGNSEKKDGDTPVRTI